jgi:hypothetical protein
VLEDSWSVSYLEGSALYIYCAPAAQLLQRASRGARAEGRPFGERELLMLIVANARVFGGGFRSHPARILRTASSTWSPSATWGSPRASG